MTPTKINEYWILSSKRDGNYGVVQEVVDSNSTIFALKILHSDVSPSHNNMHTAVQILTNGFGSHPNIASLKLYFMHGNKHCLVYEFVDGGPLSVLINQGLTFEESVVLFEQLLDGVSYAHSCLYLHKNLHPGNVIISESLQVKICDLGVTFLFDQPSSHKSKWFLAPEVLRESKTSYGSDVFSLGTIFLAMILKDLGPNNFGSFEKALKKLLPLESDKFRRSISICIEESIRKDVTKRFPTVLLFKDRFSDIIKSKPARVLVSPVFLDSYDSVAAKSGFTFVYVDGGEFRMNLHEEGPEYYGILESFYIAVTPVTQELWEIVAPKGPLKHKGPNLPITKVSWVEAVEFCNSLSIKYSREKCYFIDNSGTYTCEFKKNGFRLPTEAEWEFAAKGGMKSSGYDFSGSNILSEVGWYEHNSGGKVHDVGTLNQNELGIFDMCGNVWEWCWDWHDEYPSGKFNNPRGPYEGFSRILRGGSIEDDSLNCSVTFRDYTYPKHSRSNVGLRLVCSKQ